MEQIACKNCGKHIKKDHYRKIFCGDKCRSIYYYCKTPMGKYVQYKWAAKNLRGISFNLDPKDFKSYWKKPCSYCGEIMDGVGLDRVDNTIGYEKDNIVPCCFKCNKIKGSQNIKDFLEHIHKISDHIREY